MNTAKVKFGDLAYTNYYELFIKPSWGGVGSTGKAPFLEFIEKNKEIYKVDVDFITRELGILCSEAVLPASSYATSEVKDNFMGVTQEFAHTRLFTDIDLTFYIDRDYRVLNFFEAWMNYISGGGRNHYLQLQVTIDALIIQIIIKIKTVYTLKSLNVTLQPPVKEVLLINS